MIKRPTGKRGGDKLARFLQPPTKREIAARASAAEETSGRWLLWALVLLLLSGRSTAALMNEQTINQRLDSMDTRLRALEAAKAATDAKTAQEPVR